jgi:hypothetical protein
MSLYRATPKLLNRIMTGRIPSRAFVVGAPTNNMGVPNGQIADNATPGSPGVTNHIDGLKFRDQIDPSTLSFTMPAGMAPVSESLPHSITGAQPTVRVEIRSASSIIESGGSNAPLPGSPFFLNRYFEADFPTGTNAGWINYLVQNGWFASAGALTNANVPAALNVNLPALTKSTGSRTGES